MSNRDVLDASAPYGTQLNLGEPENLCAFGQCWYLFSWPKQQEKITFHLQAIRVQNIKQKIHWYTTNNHEHNIHLML